MKFVILATVLFVVVAAMSIFALQHKSDFSPAK